MSTYLQIVLFVALVAITTGIWSLVDRAKAIEALLRQIADQNSK